MLNAHKIPAGKNSWAIELRPSFARNGGKMNPEQAHEIVKACRETGYLPDGSRSCILCGDGSLDEPMFLGVWLPVSKKLQHRLGCSKERLANGGGRIILYMVCQACFDRPTMSEDVETEILKLAGVQ